MASSTYHLDGGDESDEEDRYDYSRSTQHDRKNDDLEKGTFRRSKILPPPKPYEEEDSNYYTAPRGTWGRSGSTSTHKIDPLNKATMEYTTRQNAGGFDPFPKDNYNSTLKRDENPFAIPARTYSPERYSVSSRNSNRVSPIRPSISPGKSQSTSSYQFENQYSPTSSRTFVQRRKGAFMPLPGEEEDNEDRNMSKSGIKIPDLPDLGHTDSSTSFNSPPSSSGKKIPDLFCGYEFDDDDDAELEQGEFVPFPQFKNSFYPINPPQDFYDPFEMEQYYNDDNQSTDIEEKKTLKEEDAEGEDREKQAVKDTGEINQDADQDVPDLAARQVRMVNGNLVLDCPVSDVLLSKYTVPLTENDREFLFMRFQACTAQPADFVKQNFSLRQRFYTQPRQTEMMVVVTMYNESEILLARTLKAVFKNIRYLYSLKHSSTWGTDAWQKVVVCIVSDGRKKINPKAKALLAAMGVYQEGFAKNKINDDKVVSHIYEYTTMVGISKIRKDQVTLTAEHQIPIQMVFCLKEKNQRKINSHAWAFQAFAEVLQPNIITLVDVGTEPQNKALYRLWKAFKDPRIAGSCGEIKASLGPGNKYLLNPLVAAQNFEYKASNVLDKPMESDFGYVTVLPGAFSAYRYRALLGAPLDKYLQGQDLRKNNNDGLFNANMYLAEDRILCFELVAKKHCSWLLKYVNNASAYTDVPTHLDELISQRRRWLNGSFFSAIYAVFHFYRTWTTSHPIGRKILLQIEFIYQFLNLLVSWFSLASYYLVFRALTVYMAQSDAHFAPGNVLSVLFLWIYLASLVTTFVLALGNRPKGTKKFYMAIVWFFAILMVYMMFAAVYMAVQAIKSIWEEHKTNFQVKYFFTETRFRDLIVATSSTYLLYLVAFTMYLQPWHMFNSFFQYLLLSPSYTNVFNVYAFCNIHDISWGTKGEDTTDDLGVAKTTTNALDGELEIVIPTTKQQIDEAYKRVIVELTTPEEKKIEPINEQEQTAYYYANMRSATILIWMFTNFILVAVVTDTGGLSQFSDDKTCSFPLHRMFIFLTVILWVVAFMACFRFIGAVTYLIMRLVNAIKLRKFRRSFSLKGALFDRK